MRDDNARRFRHELEMIEQGNYDQVRPFRTAPRLQELWDELMATRGTTSEAEVREQAKELLLSWYPSLRDSAELYRVQCLHCHGASGGGDGPTARFLDPLPRDYRRGIFKFTAVKDKARPRRADVYEVLDQGVYGTAMPSFRRISMAERHGLVDYVRLLALRGEVEVLLAATYASDEELPVGVVEETYVDVWEKWNGAGEKYVGYAGEIPPPTPELIARGDRLFHDATTGNCASCHGDTGRGDGPAAFKQLEDGRTVSAYQDDWGHDIVPRDLTLGVYRGGGRPIDIYRRIHNGINGTPMPALGDSKKADGTPLLTSEDMWALVHYVRSLSQPRQRPTHVPEPDPHRPAPAHAGSNGAIENQ
jgi:mono/diheme cytochrome c family protein